MRHPVLTPAPARCFRYAFLALAVLAVAACGNDTGTEPQFAEAPIGSASRLAVDGMPVDGIPGNELGDPWAEIEYDGESAPFEHRIAGEDIELVLRFEEKVRAKEEVTMTLRAIPENGDRVIGTVTVDFGDDRRVEEFPIDRTAELVHKFRQPDSYRVFVILVADDGRMTRGGFRIAVRDPLDVDLDVEWEGRVVPGEPTRFRLLATGVGTGELVAGDLSIDFGDGTTERVKHFDGDVYRQHTYEGEGAFPVELALLADNGREFAGSVSVEVNESGSGLDDIDMRTVAFLHADVSDWDVTSEITSITISGGGICIYHTKAGEWPVFDSVEGNPWVIANVDGTWYAGTYEWLWPGQICKGITADTIGGHVKQPPLAGWVPRSGEEVYFFVSTHARFGDRTSNERTNAMRVIWP